MCDFCPHAIPVGGGNAPFRCLPARGSGRKEEEEVEPEIIFTLSGLASKVFFFFVHFLHARIVVSWQTEPLKTLTVYTGLTRSIWWRKSSAHESTSLSTGRRNASVSPVSSVTSELTLAS